MKKVNFITSLSPQKQYAIARWFRISFLVCLCSLIIGGYFIIPQLLVYRELSKQVGALRAKAEPHTMHVKNKDALSKEHDVIRARTKKIDQYKDSPHNPYQYMNMIMQSCDSDTVLESVRFNKKECDITILCITPEYATIFIKRLSEKSLFTNVKLVSLQHDSQTKKFRCIIKSFINKN